MRMKRFATSGQRGQVKGADSVLGRRLFLISCGCLVAGPALAKNSCPRTLPIVSAPQRNETHETPTIVLHIDGWGAPLDAEQSAGSQVCIGINRSWRTAWR